MGRPAPRTPSKNASWRPPHGARHHPRLCQGIKQASSDSGLRAEGLAVSHKCAFRISVLKPDGLHKSHQTRTSRSKPMQAQTLRVSTSDVGLRCSLCRLAARDLRDCPAGPMREGGPACFRGRVQRRLKRRGVLDALRFSGEEGFRVAWPGLSLSACDLRLHYLRARKPSAPTRESTASTSRAQPHGPSSRFGLCSWAWVLGGSAVTRLRA